MSTSTIQRSVTRADPSSEPLTVWEAKKHLEIADSIGDHDAHIGKLIIAARQEWEKDTHSIIVPREITEQCKSVEQEHRLSLRPVMSITSITVNGSTLDPSTYQLVKGRNTVELPSSYSGSSWSTVVIVYMAGYEVIPEVDNQSIKLLLDLGFQPAYLVPNHREAYENQVKKRMRSTYP